jgi:Peroxisomal biogenesis factor 11 (PEX11)
MALPHGVSATPHCRRLADRHDFQTALHQTSLSIFKLPLGYKLPLLQLSCIAMASDKVTQLPFSTHALFTSTTDARITRLSRVLSTSSGVDATLTLVGYGLFLVSSQITALEKLELKSFLHHGGSKHGSTALVKLAELGASTKTLAGMCSDFRTFTRLWGLLGVYAMAKKNYVKPDGDAVLRAVSYGQTVSLAAYYVYENGYYLAGKGVLQGWTPEKTKRWAKTSLRMFLAYVLLEFVRLWRVRQLRRVRKVKAVDEKDRAEIEKEEKTWWRGAIMNVAYTPLSVHWASENPVLSDGVVGALMSAVGLVKFRAAWALAE